MKKPSGEINKDVPDVDEIEAVAKLIYNMGKNGQEVKYAVGTLQESLDVWLNQAKREAEIKTAETFLKLAEQKNIVPPVTDFWRLADQIINQSEKSGE